MRYIGGKTNLLGDIENVIEMKMQNVNTVIDVFSGSGAVAAYLKEKNYNVIGNDIMYFSYVLNRGTTALDMVPAFDDLRNNGIDDPIDFLNSLSLEKSGFDLKECFVYQNYSPHDDIKRMYFQNDNAVRIDIIRMTIEKWKQQALIDDDEYFYLLASLIAAVPYLSIIAGVYGAYLKHWDKRTYNSLVLKRPVIIHRGHVEFFNENCDTLLPKANIRGDLLYADPPYNSRQYLPNYHVLETIARYDDPAIHGVTGMRDYETQKSDFCMSRKVEGAFDRLIQEAQTRYVLISYNNEGLLPTEKLTEICEKYARPGTFELIQMDYRRYNNAGTTPGGVKEQLYFFEK